ncbi:MAG: hypothetical protein ABI171_08810 [Collimonas sp.]|uniref:DUF7220 family protein n=1 Tax=Collimonas sp. TaxID=1963772 RepID=UPI003267EB58
MTQTRKGSLFEAVVNVMIGYCINMTANFLIFPFFGWHISLQQNILLGVFYTAISIVRSYCIRRWFNKKIMGLKAR